MKFKYPTKTKILFGTSDGNLVIFFHGLFGGSLDPLTSPVIHALSKRLVQQKICSVGLYETSRNLTRDDREFLVWAKESFAGKTFSMERADVAEAVKKITSEFPSYKKLIFAGFSLGGTLSTYFLNTYNPDAVFMFGSGCTTKNKIGPIRSTYPDKEEILNNLKNFTGMLKIFQGTEDEVVPKSGAMQMIHAAKNAGRRDFIQLNGVDHRFLLWHGKPDTTLSDLLYNELVNVINTV